MEDQDRQRLAAVQQGLASITARLNALAEGHFEIGAEGFRVGSTRLLEKLISGDYHLHQRDAAGVESDLTGAKSLQGVAVSDTAPTAAQVLTYNAATGEWEPTAAGAPAAHVLATTAGLGASHTTSGLTAGQVLRATGPAAAAFQAIQDGDIPASITRDSEHPTMVHTADQPSDHATPIAAHAAAADPHTGYQKESEREAASGYAGLDASSKVIKDPANATATPTAGKIPIANGAGKLAAGWGGAASTLATLSAGTLVVQNPANATATPTASKIPIADASGKLAAGWGGNASTLATLSAGSLVVQNPANATATPTASKIPIADAGGKLAAGWLQEVLAYADLTDDPCIEHADISPAEGFVRKTGAGAYTAHKSNLAAAVGPGVDDDNTAGYSVGSRWIDTTADKEYVCLDATTGAAVWTETTGAGAGGGATTALDNLAAVAINASLLPANDSAIDLGSATPKYWANAYIDKLYLNATATLDGATAGKVNLAGNLQVSGLIGIGTAPVAGTYLKVGPTGDVSGQKGIDIAPASASIGDGGSFYAVTGTAIISTVAPNVGTVMAGLFFAALKGGTGDLTEMSAIHVSVGQLGSSGTIAEMHAIQVDTRFDSGGTPTIDDAWGVRIKNQGTDHVTRAYGLMIEPMVGAGSNYSIWAGANAAGTPRLRLDEGTPAANQTMLYLAEGITPTIRRVQWMDPGAGGVNFVGGERVMVLV